MPVRSVRGFGLMGVVAGFILVTKLSSTSRRTSSSSTGSRSVSARPAEQELRTEFLRQELLKVRGFQGTSLLTASPSRPNLYPVVAPAELEGHLLDHPDVTDVCVVGLPDEYSGEVPLAFVVPTAAAVERMKKDPGEETRTKESIMKVSSKSLFNRGPDNWWGRLRASSCEPARSLSTPEGACWEIHAQARHAAVYMARESSPPRQGG